MIYSLSASADIQEVASSLPPSHPLSLPAQNSVWEKKLNLIKHELWGSFQKELPLAFQETSGQILCWNTLLPTLPRAALGLNRHSWGQNLAWTVNLEQEANINSTQPTQIFGQQKMFAWRGNSITSSKGNSSFFSKEQGRKQRGDEDAGSLLGFYQKQTDVIIRLQSLL